MHIRDEQVRHRLLMNCECVILCQYGVPLMNSGFYQHIHCGIYTCLPTKWCSRGSWLPLNTFFFPFVWGFH